MAFASASAPWNDFFVGFIDGPDNWYVDANNALANSLAGRCGFLEVG